VLVMVASLTDPPGSSPAEAELQSPSTGPLPVGTVGPALMNIAGRLYGGGIKRRNCAAAAMSSSVCPADQDSWPATRVAAGRSPVHQDMYHKERTPFGRLQAIRQGKLREMAAQLGGLADSAEESGCMARSPKRRDYENQIAHQARLASRDWSLRSSKRAT
jgi:hypothetical protein